VLLQLTAGKCGEGLRVGADDSGAVFTGAGGVTVQQGGLAVTEGDALLGGNVTVSETLQEDGSVSGTAVTALSGELQAALTAATGAAATVTAQYTLTSLAIYCRLSWPASQQALAAMTLLQLLALLLLVLRCCAHPRAV
jgi:hypothetical protein